MRGFHVHNCARDPDCRAMEVDPPNRLIVLTPWGSLDIALNWDSRSQLWLPWLDYTKWWVPVSWHPRFKQ